MTVTPIASVLAAYDDRFALRTGSSPIEFRGFSGACVHRISTFAGDFALRAWPVASLPRSRIIGLHRLLRHVHAVGVEVVAVPVAACDGGTVVECDGRLWQLEPWRPGRADVLPERDPAKIANAMRTLAAWHAAAATFEVREAERAWFDRADAVRSRTVTERLARIDGWLHEGCAKLARAIIQRPDHAWADAAREMLAGFRIVAPAVRGELATWADRKWRVRPCLRDVWHDHVLFTGENVTGLIDASASRSDHVAVDLARLLASFFGDDFARWNDALDEYARHAPFDERDRRFVFALDRSAVALAGMAWMERSLLRSEPIHDHAAIAARVDMWRERLRNLAARIASS